MKRTILTLVLITLFTFGIFFSNNGYAEDNYSRSLLKSDQQKAQELTEKYKVKEVLGPLAPVALSPFFGLTCLSGTSILCNKGMLPENEFLMGNDTLNNGYVFAVFLALTVLTSVPKLFTTSKIFAESMDRVETYAGIISYGIILMMSQSDSNNEQVAIVYSAGVITLSKASLLSILAAINIFVINTVKYFFELLALISPIPTLDAIFEITGKAIAAALAFIYALNPAIAFAINTLLFLICLSIFRWINRRVNYLRAILLEPLLFKLKKKIFKKPDLDPDANAKRRYAKYSGGADIVIKVFTNRKIKYAKIKKRDRCRLAIAQDRLILIKPRLLNTPRILELDKSNVSDSVIDRLISYSIEVAPSENQKPLEMIFSKVYKEQLQSINAAL